MAKQNKHTWLKWTIGTWAGFKGITYLINHPHFIQDLKVTAKETIDSIGDLTEALQNMRHHARQVDIEMQKTNKTINQINRQVNQFQYKLEPRVEKINELQNHITDELNQMENRILAKNRK
jgi:methyl-accepting chemotaxis protein